jgi:flagellar hook-associated protein 1 FlgK
MRLGGLGATVAGLETIESALAEPGENGISAKLQTFWSDWEGLANDPESTAARQAVIEAGRSIGISLAELNSQMSEARKVAASQFESIAGAGGEVETIAKELAALNETIRSSVSAGSQPNDLLDRRDMLLDQLSELGQVSVTEHKDGTVEVGFGGAAMPLVEGGEVNWPQTLTEPKGKLGALLELSQPGGTIDSFQTELNAFAEKFATAVNAIHTSAGGPAFFKFTPGTGASSLAVAVSAAEVQTSGDGSSGGNEIATAIGALRGGEVDHLYAAFVTRVGTAMNEASKGETNAKSLVDTVQERRESVSGVSIDEEVTNLTSFQRAYEASARVMTVIDETLDILINRTGRAGL